MRIREHPFFTKPSFKLKENGVESLDLAELFAIIFWKSSDKESSIDMANRLLKKYNINGLAKCTLKELSNECGDEVQALKLISLFEIVKRYNKLMNWGYKRKNITSAKEVYNLFKYDFLNSKQEEFYTVLLDTKNNVIDKCRVSKGTLNQSLVHPRDVFVNAIRDGANSIILVHNHPSGDCNPSSADLEVTKNLVEGGKILGINVLDHVIVGKGKFWSWKSE